jgi:hypothetical protein
MEMVYGMEREEAVWRWEVHRLGEEGVVLRRTCDDAVEPDSSYYILSAIDARMNDRDYPLFFDAVILL